VPQHVPPSWDLRTLWVGNNQGNSLMDFSADGRVDFVADMASGGV
jgi:hypothetical protein